MNDQSSTILRLKLIAASILSAVFGFGISVAWTHSGVDKANNLGKLSPDVSELLKTASTVQTLANSPNKTIESTFDRNRDGKNDVWVLTMRENQVFTGNYSVEDLDYDGTPDRGSISIGGHENNMVLDSIDKHGRPTRLIVSVGSTIEASKSYVYRDLDRDGIFDEVSRYQDYVQKAFLILWDQRWTSAASDPKDVFKAKIMLDGSNRDVIFADREWRLAPVEASTSQK